MTGIERAIQAAGSEAALARALDVTPRIVGYWREWGWVPKLLPALLIEDLYGIPVRDLAPPACVKA